MRRAAPSALACALALAGCIGTASPEAPAAETFREDAASEIPAALPDNRSGEFAAFKETNVTDSSAHHHDYWEGRTRVEIIRMRTMLNRFSTSGASVVMRPLEGVEHLVFEGTGSVEVTLSEPQLHGCVPGIVVNGQQICSPGAADPAGSQAYSLQFTHAASDPNAWIDAGPVSFGIPLVIAVQDPTWTDMPHSTSSLWVFRISSSSASDAYTSFQVAVVAVRAEGVIPRWPGHPDFYVETHRRVVLDAVGESKEIINTPWCCPVSPDKLVSYGTRTLDIFVNITSVQGPVEPTHWFLYLHNASGRVWNLTDPVTEKSTADKRSIHWTLYVDDNAMDTPYATRSHWEFALRGSAGSPTGGSCIGGCTAYTVRYSMLVVASDELAAEYDETFPWVPR